MAALLLRTFSVASAALWLCAADPGGAFADARRPPNILFILGDNLGTDWIGCYGSDDKATPYIDKLAAQGVRFTNCWMTAFCSTSRAAIWSGRYPSRTGWHVHHDAAIYGGGGFDAEHETTFARVLRDAGYATGIFGKWQINDLYSEPEALTKAGFRRQFVWTGALVGSGNASERFTATRGVAAGERALESRYWNPVVFDDGARRELHGKFGPDEFVAQLIDFAARNNERPFLAYYAAPFTHIPVTTTPSSRDEHAPERERFLGMLRHFDGQVGLLVGELERLGLRNDTIIVFTTDNGSVRKFGGRVGGKDVRGMMGTLAEVGLDVPLIVSCPSRVAQGRTSDALVDCVDFYATFVELAGAKVPSDRSYDGQSFIAELDDDPATCAPRSWQFTEYAGVRTAGDGRYKLFSDHRLYDLRRDPLEEVNLLETTDLAPEARAAQVTLQTAIDSIPKSVDLPFPPRSQSAFKLRGEKP